jgi:HJR/Mrr/RecB family endonuclease
MWPWIIGGAVLAGKIVFEYFESKEEEERKLSSGIHEIDTMTGKQFESFLSVYYRKLGYDVTLTPSTQDYGADLILRKNGIKTIVQAKRSQKAVSVKAVQEIVGAIKHYNADKALVVTNNRFTENACNLARSNGVELWDRKKLIDFIVHVKQVK